jgi:hypothetical protein
MEHKTNEVERDDRGDGPQNSPSPPRNASLTHLNGAFSQNDCPYGEKKNGFLLMCQPTEMCV